MNCKTIQLTFDDRLDDRLAPDQATSFDRHLAACDGCRRDWEAYRAAWDAVGQHPGIEPSTGFAERTLRRLAEEGTASAGSSPPLPVLRWVLFGGAVAAIALAGWLGYRQVRVQDPQQPPQVVAYRQLELYAEVQDDEYLDDFDVIAYLHVLGETGNGDS